MADKLKQTPETKSKNKKDKKKKIEEPKKLEQYSKTLTIKSPIRLIGWDDEKIEIHKLNSSTMEVAQNNSVQDLFSSQKIVNATLHQSLMFNQDLSQSLNDVPKENSLPKIIKKSSSKGNSSKGSSKKQSPKNNEIKSSGRKNYFVELGQENKEKLLQADQILKDLLQEEAQKIQVQNISDIEINNDNISQNNDEPKQNISNSVNLQNQIVMLEEQEINQENSTKNFQDEEKKEENIEDNSNEYNKKNKKEKVKRSGQAQKKDVNQNQEIQIDKQENQKEIDNNKQTQIKQKEIKIQNETIVEKSENIQVQSQITEAQSEISDKQNEIILSEMNISDQFVGIIIGKGGQTILELGKQSGAKIQIEKQNNPNSNERKLILEGNEQQIQQIKILINDIIEKQKEKQQKELQQKELQKKQTLEKELQEKELKQMEQQRESKQKEQQKEQQEKELQLKEIQLKEEQYKELQYKKIQEDEKQIKEQIVQNNQIHKQALNEKFYLQEKEEPENKQLIHNIQPQDDELYTNFLIELKNKAVQIKIQKKQDQDLKQNKQKIENLTTLKNKQENIQEQDDKQQKFIQLQVQQNDIKDTQKIITQENNLYIQQNQIIKEDEKEDEEQNNLNQKQKEKVKRAGVKNNQKSNQNAIEKEEKAYFQQENIKEQEKPLNNDKTSISEQIIENVTQKESSIQEIIQAQEPSQKIVNQQNKNIQQNDKLESKKDQQASQIINQKDLIEKKEEQNLQKQEIQFKQTEEIPQVLQNQKQQNSNQSIVNKSEILIQIDVGQNYKNDEKKENNIAEIKVNKINNDIKPIFANQNVNLNKHEQEKLVEENKLLSTQTEQNVNLIKNDSDYKPDSLTQSQTPSVVENDSKNKKEKSQFQKDKSDSVMLGSPELGQNLCFNEADVVVKNQDFNKKEQKIKKMDKNIKFVEALLVQPMEQRLQNYEKVLLIIKQYLNKKKYLKICKLATIAIESIHPAKWSQAPQSSQGQAMNLLVTSLEILAECNYQLKNYEISLSYTDQCINLGNGIMISALVLKLKNLMQLNNFDQAQKLLNSQNLLKISEESKDNDFSDDLNQIKLQLQQHLKEQKQEQNNQSEDKTELLIEQGLSKYQIEDGQCEPAINTLLSHQNQDGENKKVEISGNFTNTVISSFLGASVGLAIYKFGGIKSRKPLISIFGGLITFCAAKAINLLK